MNETASQQLLHLLKIQNDDASRMLAVLKDEYAALIGDDLAAFDAAMDAKLRHLKHLEAQERVQQPALEAIIGAPGDRRRLEGWIDAHGNGELSAQWQALHRTLTACHQQNRLNQKVLEGSRAQVRRALEILRGIAPDAEATTYGHGGRTETAPGGGHSFGAA